MKKSILYLFLIALIAVFPVANFQNFSVALAASEAEFNLKSKSALLMDADSGEVIFEKNSNEKLPIASMTKLATLAIVFDALDSKIIKLSDGVTVSQNAAAVGGSSAFLDAGVTYNVADLIKTVIIASANDSSVALAEYVSGSEEMFAARMNKFAAGLGLENTHFENCTGLPAKNHYSTANDIAKIYAKISGNETYKSYAKIWMDELNHPSGRRTELVNTNRLVKTYEGIEGGKTGCTDAAKFCLTASAARGNVRLLAVVIGAPDSKTRFAETSKLFDYGFANFKNETLVDSKMPVSIATFKNANRPVNVYAKESVVKFLAKGSEFKFSTAVQIDQLAAPLTKGSEVGKLLVFDQNNMLVCEVPLVILEDLEAKNIGFILKEIYKNW